MSLYKKTKVSFISLSLALLPIISVQAQTTDIIVGSIKIIDNKTSEMDYIITKGNKIGENEGYLSQKEAKIASINFQGTKVLMLDKKSGKVKIYNTNLVKNNLSIDKQDEKSLSMNYKDIKLNFDLKLDLSKPDLEDSEKSLDIVDNKGLSISGDDITSEIARGSKAVRMVLEKELHRTNFAEAMEIYNFLENLNKNSNDLDIVKIARKTNLSKMFRAMDEFKPFVEEQMIKYKYSEADKKAVREN